MPIGSELAFELLCICIYMCTIVYIYLYVHIQNYKMYMQNYYCILVLFKRPETMSHHLRKYKKKLLKLACLKLGYFLCMNAFPELHSNSIMDM